MNRKQVRVEALKLALAREKNITETKGARGDIVTWQLNTTLDMASWFAEYINSGKTRE